MSEDEILAADQRDYGDEVADRCQWPGCGETVKLKLSATADEFFVLCPRHVQGVLNGEFELKEETRPAGEA